MGKVWHKPLHKRKVFATLWWPAKLAYYMKPFLVTVAIVWHKPLPYPTILKFMHISMTLLLMATPLFLLAMALALIYAEVEFFYEKIVEQPYPQPWNIFHLVDEIFWQQPTDMRYHIHTVLYFERLRLIILSVASTIDYIRLAACIVTG